MLKCFEYVAHSFSTRSYRGLANCFLDNEDDKIYAFYLLDNVRSFPSNPSGQGSSAVNQITDTSRKENDSEQKLPQN